MSTTTQRKFSCSAVDPEEHVLSEPTMRGVVGHTFSDKGFLLILGNSEEMAKTVYHLSTPWIDGAEGVGREMMAFDRFEELKEKKLKGEHVEEDLLQQLTVHLTPEQSDDLNKWFDSFAKHMGGFLNEKGAFNKKYSPESLSALMKGGPTVDQKGEPVIKVWVDAVKAPPQIKIITGRGDDGKFKWKKASVKDLHSADASRGGDGKGYLAGAKGIFFLEDMSGVWYTRQSFGVKLRLSMAFIEPKALGAAGGPIGQVRAFNRSMDALKLAGVDLDEDEDDGVSFA